MSPDLLGTALRDLVYDAERDLAAPVAIDLWAAGRRRRVRAVAVPALVMACVATLVALTLWPAGAPRASVPAVQVDDGGTARLTAYPDVIAKPPSIPTTAAPGVTAALVPSGDAASTYAASPAGVVRRLSPSALPRSFFEPAPSLSPDGRWMADGFALTDLVRGTSPTTPAALARMEQRWAPLQEPGWWSPSSRLLFIGTFNQGTPVASGVVIGLDGTTTEVPLVEGGLQATFAGWLDDRTLYALLDLGPGTTRLEVRTWSLGERAWKAPGTIISWRDAIEGDPEMLHALLSPDGQRLLLTAPVTNPDSDALDRTDAMMFDPRTGAQLGMPSADGSVDPSTWDQGSAVSWQGWGCRPAWHDGLPVRTDGDVSGFVDRPRGLVDGTSHRELVAVSSGYGGACVAFAGNELRGTPVTNHLAVWQERLFAWGVPLLLLVVLGCGVWWVLRRRNYPRRPPRRLPMIITQPF
ncbi:MAG TPA: hypothetical protein VF143_09120 [Candidatus Nanopelagicales bacterium]